MKYEIKCGFCGENFESTRTSAKYCSDNCRVKYHQLKKKQEENTSQQLTIQQEERSIQYGYLEQQIISLIQKNRFIIAKAKRGEREKQHYIKMIREIGINIKYTELQIQEDENKQKRIQKNLSSKHKKVLELKKKANEKSEIINRLTIMLDLKKTEKEVVAIENEIEKLYKNISSQKREHIHITAELEEWKDRLGDIKKHLNRYRETYQNNHQEIEAIKKRMNNPDLTQNIIPIPQPVIPKRIPTPSKTSGKSIGAGDLQHINFQTFRLSGELGAFLGELDRNKTCFALTGDSGAGKSWFSFEMARLFIAEMGFSVKYFSLEEGVGKLTQEKVVAYGLGNELNLVGIGSLEDVRTAAKEYPMVIVDSFNSLNTKAEEFEKLRTDFPNTIFLLIFQKTTAGTIRGGSAIKYNSSATINVIIREGQRIAIMEKGRYGTIGWEYSITQKRLIKTGDTF
ncbi:MAG: hypothetical protein KDD41_03645 [Flavobacteriales bacterium]|nr:hypothetical protein [Flavobacteriales bacterium]